jgi:hypothetical protein
MSKFISVTALWALNIYLGVLVLQHGWGLEVKSWGWVIGVGVFGRISILIIEVINKDN